MKASLVQTSILMLFFMFLTGTAATDEPSSACCPDGFVALAGGCYVIGSIRPADWNYCRELCNDLMADSDTWSSDLASIDTDFLSAFTAHVEDKLPAMSQYTYWVGAIKIDGVWQWLDGSPISNMSYIWYSDAPTTSVQDSRGMLHDFGYIHNRFYMKEESVFAPSPAYICEAKKTKV